MGPEWDVDLWEAMVRKVAAILAGIIVVSCAVAGYGSVLTGVVVDDQARPVDGAEVVVIENVVGEHNDDAARAMTPVVKTGKDGAFEISQDVRSANFTFILARKRGLASAWDCVNQYDNTHGLRRFLLVLEKPDVVAGTVVDDEGRPIPGAAVQAVPRTSYLRRLEQTDIWGPKEWFTTTTDSQGRFRFGQLPADASAFFWVTAPQRNCTYVFPFDRRGFCAFPVGMQDVRLVLPSERRVTGRVVDEATGRPVAGAELAFSAWYEPNDTATNYRAFTVVSGAHGVFTCRGLSARRHSVELSTRERQKGRWAAKPMVIDVEPDAQPRDLSVSLTKGGAVELSIHEAGTSRPLSDFYARASGGNAFYVLGLDPSGTTRLTLAPGEYKVDFWREPYFLAASEDTPFRVEVGKTVQLPFVIERGKGLSGRVLLPDGGAAEGVLVTVNPYGDEVYTQAKGEFQVESAGSEADVFAADTGRGLVSVMHVKGERVPVDVRLQPSLQVVGTIVDPNGKGIPAARVSLLGKTVVLGAPEVLTDAKGRYLVHAVRGDSGGCTISGTSQASSLHDTAGYRSTGLRAAGVTWTRSDCARPTCPSPAWWWMPMALLCPGCRSSSADTEWSSRKDGQPRMTTVDS